MNGSLMFVPFYAPKADEIDWLIYDNFYKILVRRQPK